ncbi:unnamed protein product [Phytophthora fragariaefolia]|uniref:Unnamed protein product n=1 Tax=Phytophthora fragariaefolia TaxID=1490495 RepID=A0A9W6U0Y6_9STRA|nr:unnamed protein product [Phytophthora fragariaefolia]
MTLYHCLAIASGLSFLRIDTQTRFEKFLFWIKGSPENPSKAPPENPSLSLSGLEWLKSTYKTKSIIPRRVLEIKSKLFDQSYRNVVLSGNNSSSSTPIFLLHKTPTVLGDEALPDKDPLLDVHPNKWAILVDKGYYCGVAEHLRCVIPKKAAILVKRTRTTTTRSQTTAWSLRITFGALANYDQQVPTGARASAASPTPGSPGQTIQISNPFDTVGGEDEDVEMPTAGPQTQPRPTSQRVTAAPSLPQPPRFAGRTMQDRRYFMQKYEAYLAAVYALQAPYSGAFAMPVAACIEPKTKSMIARYVFNTAPNLISEQQWVDYFLQAKVPSLGDYAAVDAAMKQLEMKAIWPEPESRMMNLQADVEGILDKFNLIDIAFEHELRRLVNYLADALAPPRFKVVVATKLTLHQNKKPFLLGVTPGATTDELVVEDSSLVVEDAVDEGVDTELAGVARKVPWPMAPASTAADTSEAPSTSSGDRQPTRSSCLKCQSADHQVRECSRCTPVEATRLLRELRERREARRSETVRKFDIGDTSKRLKSDDRGSVAAAIGGITVTEIMLDTGADTSLVARGVLEALAQLGKVLRVNPVAGIILSPVGKEKINVTRIVIFDEVVLTTLAGPLTLRNLSFCVKEDNDSLEVIVGRPIMKLLVYSTDKLLVESRKVRPDWELGVAQSDNPEPESAAAATPGMRRLYAEPPMPLDEEDGVERHELRTATPTMYPTNLTEVIQYLEKKVEIATEMGLTLDGQARLTAILYVRADSFRVDFGYGLPVRVAPMQVHLKAGAKPVRAQPCRYSPTDRAFPDRHTRALLDHGLVYKNHRSRWASAPRIARKNEQDSDTSADPHITIDTRSVNEKTEPMP